MARLGGLWSLLVLLPVLVAAGCQGEDGIFVVEEEGAEPITIEEYGGPALAAEIAGIYDRFDRMVAKQSTTELLELSVQRHGEIAGAITKSRPVRDLLDHGVRMPLKVYRRPPPKLDEAIAASVDRD